MATLISNASGLMSGASTFAAAETGTGALNRIRFSETTSIGIAATVTSASFTVTNAKVIDGVMLWCKNAQSATPNGTFKVDLQKGGVSQASVTVNKTDLPTNVANNSNTLNHPIFFKFTSTATGDGGSNWTIVLTTTGSAGSVCYGITASGSTNVAHVLRTTTAATPGASDDLLVTGELTGAGTHNAITVTMDSTSSATTYGNGTVSSTTVAGGLISVGCYGTLAYGGPSAGNAPAAATNYYLKVAGDVIVGSNGTFSIGSSGSEVPRDSTAVLEFSVTGTSADYGLRCQEGSTLNIAGLSRTSGKNVTRCLLNSNLTSSSVLTSHSDLGVQSDSTGTVLEATGTSLVNAGSFVESSANSGHGATYTAGATVAGNTTQVATVWLTRGTGANNRYVRVIVGSSAAVSPTNGFYSDIDLQAGTAGTATAIGNGTATSVSITAQGTGYVIRLVGKVSSGTATPSIILAAGNASGVVTYTGTAGSNDYNYDHVALVTTSSLSDTSIGVDTDTGWKNGDVICVASTSRTLADCELFALNADAGASSMTSALYPCGTTAISSTPVAHSGTSPTQGEIGLLTRNVKIRSTSTSLGAYVWLSFSCTATITWAEFNYIGTSSGTAQKGGIELDISPTGVSSAARSITYCSVHDSNAYHLFIRNTWGTNDVNLTFSNNVCWNAQTSFISINQNLTSSNWTFDSNLCVKCSSVGMSLSDVGGTLTNNNVIAASTLYGINLAVSNALLGTISGNVTHTCGSSGLALTGSGMIGTITNHSAWRNGGFGLNLNGGSEITVTNPTLFGNTTTNFAIQGDIICTVNGGTIAGDASFSTTNGVACTIALQSTLIMNGVDMSGSGTGLAAHSTTDFLFTGTYQRLAWTLNNVKFGAFTAPTKTTWTPGSYMAVERWNQTAGDHRCEMTYGQLKTDTTIYHTASPSMRMTPNSASNKLASAPTALGMTVPAASGVTNTVTVYVRKSSAGDGAAYTGNQQRLIQRRNDALGQTADVVLATASASTGTWEQLSGTTSSPTDDGAWELIVDCDGTAGWTNVDDWAIS